MSAYLGTIKVWDAAAWDRPAAWLALPTILPTEEKVAGLHGVWPATGNFCALRCSGAYTVDWGDGTSEDVASGVTAAHEYDYAAAALDDATVAAHGHKQALVIITPQTGQSLTSVDFQQKHPQAGLVDGYVSGWLDLRGSVPACTSLTLGGTAIKHARLRRYDGVACGALTTMASLCLNCCTLTALDLSSFDTAAVTSMANLFYNCSALALLDLSSFDTAAVTSMESMFYNCSALALLDLSSFDTAAVTSMASMFQGCYALTALDLSSFDTAAVTDMDNMFYNCYALTALDLSSFYNSFTTSMTGMFTGCLSLAALDFPCRRSFSVASAKLSGSALDALYTSLPTLVGRTLIVTGNYGVSDDTPSIATAKGWTITG